MDPTEEQWDVLKSIIPALPRRHDGRGRPWCDPRAVLNGMLWLLRTGAQWQDLPPRYPAYHTCHRRFQRWVHSGVLDQLLYALADDLHERGGLDRSACFIDGTFVVAKTGGGDVGKTKRGKGTKIMAMADRLGLPLAIHVASASPHEVTLVAPTLAACTAEPEGIRRKGYGILQFRLSPEHHSRHHAASLQLMVPVGAKGVQF